MWGNPPKWVRIFIIFLYFFIFDILHKIFLFIFDTIGYYFLYLKCGDLKKTCLNDKKIPKYKFEIFLFNICFLFLYIFILICFLFFRYFLKFFYLNLYLFFKLLPYFLHFLHRTTAGFGYYLIICLALLDFTVDVQDSFATDLDPLFFTDFNPFLHSDCFSVLSQRLVVNLLIKFINTHLYDFLLMFTEKIRKDILRNALIYCPAHP